MPVQKLMRAGKAMYRYGDSGKVYATREEAEKQGRAMYASGYRSKESTATKDQRAERAGRRVTKDIEYDMKRKR
jgi:hypothetical protein